MGEASLLRQPSSPEQLHQFAEAGFLYAITDGAGEPLLTAMLRDLGQSHACPVLIPGAAQQELIPYIVAVDALLLEWLRQTVWPRPWGVFALAKSDLASLAQHFARFLLVTMPDGDQWFFRFYDPRVLGIYLPNCSPEELSSFCGPVRAFAIPHPDGAQVELMQFVAGSAEAALPAEAPVEAQAGWGLRPDQLAALQPAAVDSFDDRVADHLRQFFPEQCQNLGADGLKEAIDYGIHRAAAYRIELERDICVFLELMFTFGVDFDRQVSWAATILNDPAILDPSQKIEKLFQEAARHVQKAMQHAVGVVSGS